MRAYGIFWRACGQTVEKLLNLPWMVALLLEYATQRTASGGAEVRIFQDCEGSAAAFELSSAVSSLAFALQRGDVLDEALAHKGSGKGGDFLWRKLGGEQGKVGGGGLRLNALHLELRLYLAEVLEAVHVDLGRGPVRREDLHPAFRLEAADDPERVFLMHDLFEFIATLKVGERGDVVFLLAGVVALLGFLVHGPAESSHQAGRADHAGGIFNKAVIGGEAKLTVFDVRDAVERVHQKAVGAFVERQSHRAGGKVAAAKVLKNGCRFVDRLTRLRVGDGERGADLHANAAWEAGKKRLSGFQFAGDDDPSFLQVFTKLRSASLNHYIKIADWRAAGEVSDRSADEKYGEGFGTGELTNRAKGVALGG